MERGFVAWIKTLCGIASRDAVIVEPDKNQTSIVVFKESENFIVYKVSGYEVLEALEAILDIGAKPMQIEYCGLLQCHLVACEKVDK